MIGLIRMTKYHFKNEGGGGVLACPNMQSLPRFTLVMRDHGLDDKVRIDLLSYKRFKKLTSKISKKRFSP